MPSPLEVTCTITGERESVAIFDAFDKAAKDALRKVLSENGNLLLGEIRKGAPNGTGELRRNIRKSTLNDGLTVTIKASRKQWAYAEWGSGPLGSMTATNPPTWLSRRGTQGFPNWRGPLAAWAKSRALNPFLVAKGIFLRKGTRAKPFFTPVVDQHKERILAEISAAVAGSVPSWIGQQNDWRGNREGVTVAVGGASFDSTESGWVG
jgi:HK97 gp10 family phage protein